MEETLPVPHLLHSFAVSPGGNTKNIQHLPGLGNALHPIRPLWKRSQWAGTYCGWEYSSVGFPQNSTASDPCGQMSGIAAIYKSNRSGCLSLWPAAFKYRTSSDLHFCYYLYLLQEGKKKHCQTSGLFFSNLSHKVPGQALAFWKKTGLLWVYM